MGKVSKAIKDIFAVLFVTIGILAFCGVLIYAIHKRNAIDKRPQYTYGIVTEISWRYPKSSVFYVYAVDGIVYRSVNRFNSAADSVDIQIGDTVYVIYEDGDPQNAMIKTEGYYIPIYSKRVTPDK